MPRIGPRIGAVEVSVHAGRFWDPPRCLAFLLGEAGGGALNMECKMTFTELGLAEPILKALAAKIMKPRRRSRRRLSRRCWKGATCAASTDRHRQDGGLRVALARTISTATPKRQRHSCRMLVLSPTRELAAQIADSFRTYARFMKLSVATIFGGVPINRQIRQLQEGVDVLVATPGRLLDLIDQRAFTLLVSRSSYSTRPTR